MSENPFTMRMTPTDQKFKQMPSVCISYSGDQVPWVWCKQASNKPLTYTQNRNNLQRKLKWQPYAWNVLYATARLTDSKEEDLLICRCNWKQVSDMLHIKKYTGNLGALRRFFQLLKIWRRLPSPNPIFPSSHNSHPPSPPRNKDTARPCWCCCI